MHAHPVHDESVCEGLAGEDGALRDADGAVGPRRADLPDAVPVDAGVLGVEVVVDGDHDGVALRGADGGGGELAVDGHGQLLEAVLYRYAMSHVWWCTLPSAASKRSASEKSTAASSDGGAIVVVSWC
jgi:hypothetical protein